MNERGYTLIEAWLVLSVIGVLIVMSQVAVIQPFNKMVDSQILAQFQYDFTLAQAVAMQYEKPTVIEIRSPQTYEIRYRDQTTVRTLPTNVMLEHNTESGRTFAYSERGSPSVIGRFLYKGTSNAYNVKIQFGRGRIEIAPR